MKPFQVTLGFLAATIVLAMSGCGSDTDSTISDQTAKQEASVTSSGQPTSDQDSNQNASRVTEVKAGVQPAWSNEGDQSKELLVTLRSSRAQLDTGESANLKSSANNRSGKSLSLNMFLQLGNGLIISSTNSCTGDPCTGQFDIPDGVQALMSVVVQSSGPIAEGYSVVLHYDYTDSETGNKVQGKVEGLIGSTEHVVVRAPSTSVPAPKGNKLVPESTPAPTSHSNLATAPTYTPEPTYPSAPTYTPVTIPTATLGLPTPYPTSTPRPTYTPVPTSTPPGFKFTSSRILFTSRRDGYQEIYVMNTDGTGQTRLTNNGSVNPRHEGGSWHPIWSPNGQRIAFLSVINRVSDIYIMNVDGTGHTNLTNDPASESDPTWSPDGKKIAFSSRRDGPLDIYVVNSDGTGLTNLTNNPGADLSPNWSPDGKRIVFYSRRDGYSEIYVMNSDGTGLTNLTNNPGDDGGGWWSPDGRRIAFTSTRDGDRDGDRHTNEIYVMNSDGTGQTNLTNNPGEDNGVTWSPDGKKIAFTSNRDENHDIYVVSADGSGQTNLTNKLGPNYYQAWSPDGKRIVFYSNRDRNSGIYVMNADGTGQTRLTKVSGRAPADISWSPFIR